MPIKKPKKLKWVWFGVCLVSLLLFLGYAVLSVFQAFRYTTNTNTATPTTTPASLGLAYNEVSFETAAGDGINLRGWWIPAAQSERVLIFVHGRGGDRASYSTLFKPLHEAGFNILTFDLRGHGQSDSAYCTWGIKEQWDVIGAVEFAKSKGFKTGKIGALGWSVGAASVLMALRSDTDLKAVVSDSAYANSDPLLAHNLLYPGLVTALRLTRNIDVNAIDPSKAITELGQRHVFLIHGATDSSVAVSNFYQLQQAGGSNVTASWLVPQTNHVQAIYTQTTEYIRRVIEFFNGELN
jgi:dipeptidyl aminopeptidase/acylaminoacyl peptidase